MTPTNPAQGVQQWSTYSEILAQPDIWRSWAPVLTSQVAAMHAWLSAADHDTVWFCGAGTSAFIGESLAFYLNSHRSRTRFQAVASTDLVAQPQSFFQQHGKLLVVSFGRSGDSSESLGTLAVLDTLCPQADRMHITCNAQSALATRAVPGPGVLRTVILPPETEDSGFAMTSSYTTMLLSALACFDRQAPLPVSQALPQLADAADALFRYFAQHRSEPAYSCPERAVFLGSGVLRAAARESALKILELSAGRVATLWDSTLGFRHGPKAFVIEQSRVYVLVSNDPHTQRYDLDVAREVREQYGDQSVLTIGPAEAACDIPVPTVGNDAWSVVLYVLFAQFFATQWSHAMGLNVDNPFSAGNLTRVVSGVKLYLLSAD